MRTPVEAGPGGGEGAREVGQEPGQGRRLLLQRHGVEHLRLDHPAARNADQVQAVAGSSEREVIQRDDSGRIVRVAVLAQGDDVGQIGGDATDVLGVRVERRE